MPKKSDAQLQREIDEALARPPSEEDGDDGSSGVQFGRVGTKVSIEPTPSNRRRSGKGLIHKTRKYGVLMEDARIGPGGGWDVYDVRLPDGSETSAYGFALRLAPSAIFREAVKKRSHAAVKAVPRDWAARQMTSGRRVIEKAHGDKIARIFQGESHWTVTINHREPRWPFETTGEITRQSANTLAAAKSLGTRLLKV